MPLTEPEQRSQEWFGASYERDGIQAQRRYPNEELVRFVARRYASLPTHERSGFRVLEVGCGACANLWMLAREGFQAYGLDLSEKSISLGREILKEWDAPAELAVGTMRELPLGTGMFDAVVDVFSSYCLTQTEFEAYCEEVARVLKPGGWYFSFTPSKNVNSYKQADPKDMIDANTLSGITDSSEPFYGNFYPFRFMAPLDARKDLQRVGLDLKRTETTHRTYGGMSHSFEWLVLDAVKAG